MQNEGAGLIWMQILEGRSGIQVPFRPVFYPAASK